ncbi:MAG TPA: substrate-binding domain-containing protein [Micropepsaceae bacterium]|nr:substrate-binding domain-containing protein [Micropepsaceae bacterium]
MKGFPGKALLLGTAAILLAASPAFARDQIKIVGSSTVFPFTSAVAEQFGAQGQFPTPVVESTGTGGGMKIFCEGTSINTPDVTSASRRMKIDEFRTCQFNGVTDITEVKIGYDGIVLANSKAHSRYTLSFGQVFLALAAKVPTADGVVDNPYKMWNEIDPSLPAEPISVMGPPPTSGTRDSFNEMMMEQGCAEAYAAFSALPAPKGKDCHPIRQDGVFIEAGENDNLIVQKLEADPNLLGAFGYSFLEENLDKLQATILGGVEPTAETIAAGDYKVSRSMYIYVKNAHVGTVPGLKEFVEFYVQEGTFGPDGFLVDKGLIPLSDEERSAIAASAAALTPLEM